MGIVSYAQNFEDVILWRALHDVSPGFYIDIGAQHPVVDSVSKAFYEQGWRGIHVEPTTLHANLLRADRPDETVVQAIIADQAGAMKFYEIEGTGLSTARQDIADEHRAKLSYPVRETLVTAITLSDLLKLAPQDDIHWLKVDVEGFERQVFSGWMPSPRRPWIIAVESTYPTTPTDTSAEWESLVLDKGYRLVYCDGLNRFYLHHDHAELESRFAYPPNVFDGFQLSGTATSMTSWLVQRNQKDVSQLESRLAATEEQHRSTAQALVEQQSRAVRQTGELQQELGALQSTLQKARREFAERERLTVEAFGKARDEMRLHAQQQLESRLQRERELGEQQLQHQEIARQRAKEMSGASAEREAGLQQELAALHAALEEAKEQAAARERQQHEAFSQAQNELHRQAQAQLQALLDRERELGERLLQQQEAARQSAATMSLASAEREEALRHELAVLRSTLDEATRHAATRERQQQEAFSQSRDEFRRQAQAHMQALLDRERELSERLLLQQEAARKSAAEMGLASAEREEALRHDLAVLHSSLDQAKRHAAARERQHQEAFSQSRDEFRRQMLRHMQALVERERAFAEQLAQVQQEAQRTVAGQAQMHIEREKALYAEIAAVRDESTHREAEAQSHLWHLIERERLLGDALLQLQHDLAQQEREQNVALTAQGEVHRAIQLELTDVVGKLDTAEKEATMLRIELARQIEQAGLLAAEIAEIRKTFSWRITSPLRLLGGLFSTGKLSSPTQPRQFSVQRTAIASLAESKPTKLAPTSRMPDRAQDQIHFSPRQENSVSMLSSNLYSLRQDQAMTSIQHINQLLELHDATFVEAVYQALLGRAPDPEGMHYYLGRLRAGYGKQSVITQLAESVEAKLRKANIPGLQQLVIAQKKTSHWFWGFFFRGKRVEQQVYRLEHELGCIMQQLAIQAADSKARFMRIEHSLDGVLKSYGSPDVSPGFHRAIPHADEIYKQLKHAIAVNETTLEA